MKIILASNSPRRHEILNLANIKHEVIALDHIEKVNPGLTPKQVVKSLAYQKALPVYLANKEDIVIGSDTIVFINNTILGKPKNRDEAIEMLKMLSGNTHLVVTGVAILSKKKKLNFCETTKVTFNEMTEEEICYYVDHENIYDKAGSYAIQGLACRYIKTINGDFYNVMGLPIARVSQALKSFN